MEDNDELKNKKIVLWAIFYVIFLHISEKSSTFAADFRNAGNRNYNFCLI